MSRNTSYFRYFTLAAVFLLLVSTHPPLVSANQKVISSSQPLMAGSTLYVGGGGEGNYTRIQDAIDNASDGDTVFVFSGLYEENLVINKSINLIGEDRETTIIDAERSGRKDVILLTGGNTTVQGFYLTNENQQASGVNIKSDNNQIVDCVVRDTGWDGIYIGDYYENRYNNVVSDCLIINNNYYGVHIWGGGVR